MAGVPVGLLVAFGAGMLSFLSPCVFPLVPGYLSYLAGTTVREAQEEGGVRWRVTTHALFFVAGFALIFALFGAVASSVGAALQAHKLVVERAAGLVLIVFGALMTGRVPLPFLMRERRVHVTEGEPALLRSALIGVAFGAGWSPCIGPVLGSILALSATGTTLAQGVLLLLVYAVGLGVPFVLVGLLIDRATPIMRRINRYSDPIAMAGGSILVVTGLLILSGQLAPLANYAPVISF